jgi:hypothetical protein
VTADLDALLRRVALRDVEGPSTTAVLPDLGSSTTLAFTVEPGSGSDRPTTTPFASLPLN